MLVIEVPRVRSHAQIMLQSMRALRAAGRLLGRRQPLIDFEVKLTRSMGLFDRKHYLAQVSSAELKGLSALRHYVLFGDAAGLTPSPLFDLKHYDAHCGERHGLNRLLHYGLVLRHLGVYPTAWFDGEYYLQANPDVQQSGRDPLEHFQNWGWREGRNPLPGLDLRRLMSSQPELRVAKDSPLSLLASGALAHLLHDQSAHTTSARTGDPPRPKGADHSDADLDLLDPTFWVDLQPRVWEKSAVVDVIIPVHSGAIETLRCLWSVLNAPVHTPHRVVVINDAGPDPELNAKLRNLAARDLFTLEQNKVNLGFVKTVNLGLRLQRDRDVVILNSDTEVYGDWLDRLVRHAQRRHELATITPLSNNATICSYPEPQSDNRYPIELSHAEIDAIASEVNAGEVTYTPTGVGFCMFIRRSALNEVGLLDERRFGRGYGEENDLCQRMLRQGWRHGIACDTYVRHVGSISFKGEATVRTAAALKTLNKLYPNYDADVQRHIASDPAWIYRARIDLARFKRLAESSNVLLVCHNRGGGTERHLVEQTKALQDQGKGVFELRPSHQPGCVALVNPALYRLHSLAALPPLPSQFFEEVLETLAIREIHVHHLIDFPSGMGDQLIACSRKLKIRLRMALHDYYAICPRVNLVNSEGQYCAQPPAQVCNACLAKDDLHRTTGTIETWRAGALRLLEAADQVVVPSSDVQQRLQLMAPHIPIQIEPHEVIPSADGRPLPAPRADEPLRVLAIGAISKIKGYDVLRRLAITIQERRLPMELALLGYSMDDTGLGDAGVKLLGRYFDQELPERIRQYAPHLIFVPSVWPETYCYVLSAALQSGRRVAVFDLGAQAERVREHHPDHLVIPLWQASAPEEMALRLLSSSFGTPSLANAA
ncbi:MAG: glycosyltransferase [Ideonella sp.]|nr:glycosyltransferase [Ideonella sp.]